MRENWDGCSVPYWGMPKIPPFRSKVYISMNRFTSKVMVDAGMALTMMTSLVTGLVLWLALPRGRQTGQSVLLGLTRLVWSDIHTYSSLTFAVILLLHLALNMRFFVRMAKCMLRLGKSPEEGAK